MLLGSAPVSASFPTLPALFRRPSEPVGEQAGALPSDLGNRAPDQSLLIVDDDQTHAESLRVLCESAGYQVRLCHSGEAGLAAIAEAVPSVLVLDLNMPGMDGADVLRVLTERGVKTKTIVLTGTQDVGLVGQIVRLGAYDFLTKPAQPAQLLSVIRRAIELVALEAENERNRLIAMRANALREFLVEATTEFVYVLDSDGKFTYLNNKLDGIFNADRSALQGAPWQQLFSDVAVDAELSYRIAEQRSGERSTREFQFCLTTADGNERTLLCTSTGLYASSTPRASEFLGTYGVIRDVTVERQAETDRLEMERQLQQIGKMEAMGQLTGGIAHDFNNILAGILGYAELVQSAHQRLTPELMNEYLGEVVQAGHRARDLIAQMQTFTRTNRSAPDAVDLTACVTSISRMLRAAIPSTIGLLTNYEDDLPPALADPVQFQQIVLNLMINARDAIDGKGVIELSVMRHSDPVSCSVCNESMPGPHLVLSVRDTGHGIPAAIRRKIFEMHYSTRVTDGSSLGNVPGSGTGIGLWLINSLVHDYGGHLTLETEVDVGSTFAVHLPMASVTGLVSDVSRAPLTLPGEIVVVDDVVSVASFIGELLRVRGLDAVVFSDSHAALNHLQDPASDVSMLITDQAMPGLTGLDLIAAARGMQPDLPTILITAYSSEAHRQRMQQLDVNALITKPFRAAELLTAIADHAPQPKDAP